MNKNNGVMNSVFLSFLRSELGVQCWNIIIIFCQEEISGYCRSKIMFLCKGLGFEVSSWSCRMFICLLYISLDFSWLFEYEETNNL